MHKYKTERSFGKRISAIEYVSQIIIKSTSMTKASQKMTQEIYNWCGTASVIKKRLHSWKINFKTIIIII